MRKGPIILLVGTAAVVGWIAPGLEAGNGRRPAASVDPVEAATRQVRQDRREAWLAGETVLPREADGHFYADAMVGNARMHFLVDTGASIVALTGADAQAIGLEWNDSDIVGVGRGAGGPVYGVPVRLERLELGGFEARDVEAAIIPEGLDVSLLGQSFLSKLSGVRIEDDRMVIGPGS
ncbi:MULTISPECIES: retropepsin-like aspartic protease family protein [Novosphingobium]|uniref:Aspartyl protease family protein n=1 Tax=Novosphingobium mathurense TaxID=428990 RepID=A0A1U6IF60_9SPHN|nr:MULTISPECIES: TIGR02281 family clan AA aspartic protease [Novosphingobium]CDO37158.1 putative transmembrane signal peptide [Novosphingobium sp. KN65.2]SLK06632.1 aspartyl protease family protein [Novosphingobium mathurense]